MASEESGEESSGMSKTMNKESLFKAIKDVLVDKKGIRPTAASYKIPKSNLARYIKRFKEEVDDVSKAIDDEQTFKDVVTRISSHYSDKLVRLFIFI